MSDTNRLLELIEEGIVEHGGDLSGWTRQSDEILQVFDGRVSLRAELSSDGPARDGVVHVHVFATLHEYDDEVLDACLFGTGPDREGALAEAAFIWISCVAGPIRSFTDSQPVCMTCQAGVENGDATKGFSPGDYGLPGLRAYVGPSVARGFDDERIQESLNDSMPWFRFAAESAAPRRVHMAKSIIISNGNEGWRRELEIDGHEVSHEDPNWPTEIQGPDFGYLTRYAVFEFPRNSNVIVRRAELERTIRAFAESYPAYDSIDELMEVMVDQGFDPELVHEVESVSTIAFGRMFFETQGVQYSPTVIRARRDGRVESEVPLMSIPAYTRARVLAVHLSESMSEDDFQSLCLYNAESQAILQALDSHGADVDLSQMTMFPCVVPDRDVSDQTMASAMQKLDELLAQGRATKQKPWWKFW